MKQLKKLMLITLTAIIIIYSLIPPKVVEAQNITTEQVGDAIAATAKDFIDRYAEESIYDCGIANGYYNEYTNSNVTEYYGRENAYKNKKTSGIAYDLKGNPTEYENLYAMDCVGFVSMIVHRATGLGSEDFTFFVLPTIYTDSGITWKAIEYFQNSNSNKILAGDLICYENHVAIASGNLGTVYDSVPAGVRESDIDSYGDYVIVRIKPQAVSKITELNYTWYEKPENEDKNEEVVDNSPIYEIHNHGYGNSEQFYYNGMPLSGEYAGQDKGNWLIDTLMDVGDWLVGIITIGYKIQIVGWSSAFQNLANGLIEAIINGKMNKAVTVETILFNQIQILDVNFFNFDTAAGEKITEDDLIYILRQNLAGIYYLIRNTAIIVLLVILIYVGIRMAISTASGDKAKYKKMFWSWCVGFIVVMFIHYFMVFIINVNEQVISYMSPGKDATVIYDEVRSYAYEIPASKGWTGAIIYVFLVYYMIKLLIFYLKRLLIVYLLAVMGPIMGLSYAIEMMNGKSKSLTTWMKEFAFNIIIQSIHVITYSLFMNIIYGFMQNVNIIKLIPYAVIMIAILNLILKSEKIIKNIFGLKSSTMKNVTDKILQTSGVLMTATAIAKPIYKFGKSKLVNHYNNNLDAAINRKYKSLENPEDAVNNSKLASDIQREIDRLKEQEKEQIKQYDANAFGLAKNVFGGLSGMVKSVPIMFEAGPVEGTLSIINAGSKLNSVMESVEEPDLDEEKIDRLLQKYGMLPDALDLDEQNDTTDERIIRKYNTEKNKRYTLGGFALSSATARGSTKIKNLWESRKEINQKINNPYQTARIELLYKLQTQVLEEEAKLNSAIEQLKENGFPPVFYNPDGSEDDITVALNLSLKEQYREQLELNLKQASNGEPQVEESEVADYIENYVLKNGHTPKDLAELQEMLDEIAEDKNFDVGAEVEDNVRNAMAQDLTNMAEDKDTKINRNVVESEILEKVEEALRHNDWDESASQSDIISVVTNDVAEEIMEKLSASELTSIITSAINRKGTLNNKQVMPEFEDIVRSTGKIADINNDIAELTGGEKYDSDELINTILNKDILD